VSNVGWVRIWINMIRGESAKTKSCAFQWEKTKVMFTKSCKTIYNFNKNKSYAFIKILNKNI